MDSVQALAVVRSLANGVDPESGEVFPPESTYQRPQIVRALYEAATALERIERFVRRRARAAGVVGCARAHDGSCSCPVAQVRSYQRVEAGQGAGLWPRP